MAGGRRPSLSQAEKTHMFEPCLRFCFRGGFAYRAGSVRRVDFVSPVSGCLLIMISGGLFDHDFNCQTSQVFEKHALLLTLLGTNISHLGKTKIIFKRANQ